MTTTDNIFALEPRNTSAFERTTLETFRFQADRCAVCTANTSTASESYPQK